MIFHAIECRLEAGAPPDERSDAKASNLRQRDKSARRDGHDYDEERTDDI